jgi:riboflavin synthase
MFTGLVEELGLIAEIRHTGSVVRFQVRSPVASQGTKVGDSISVSGVCLTVVEVKGDRLSFEAVQPTFQATTFKSRCVGDQVNIERALRVGDRVGGHFVTGHVDCVGVVRSRKTEKGHLVVSIGVPSAFLKYLVPKGSVAVDGISLTLAKIGGGFSVNVIPHTAKATTLGFCRSADKVNVEFDILAKRR